jgi:lipoate-protein ligase A
MNWTFINSGTLSGESNMLLDLKNAMQLSNALQSNTQYECVFRIYAWDKPTLSLGKNQVIEKHVQEKCLSLDIPIVHRPTGGRAVLHSNELTYCITMPCVSMEDARKAYQDIHEFFLSCLNKLPLSQLEFAKGTLSFHEHYQNMESSACFSASARHELTCNGKKLIGSAQRLIDGVLLQHGSLPLDDTYLNIAHILSKHDEEEKYLHASLSEHSTSLARSLGYSCDFSEIADIISSAWNKDSFLRI